MIFDSHCHLNYFSLNEIPDLIDRATKNNVTIINTICTTISEFSGLLTISNNYANVFCSVGIHPSNAANGEYITISDLIELTKNKKVVGIGETGLDFFKCENIQDQKRSFLSHIETAQQTGLPLIIHSREADEMMMEILDSEMKNTENYKTLFNIMRDFASH